MIEKNWFYVYTIEYFDDIENKNKTANGLVLAMNKMSDAVNKLEAYYGDDIINIEMLQAVESGNVFEFEFYNDEISDFPFSINKKGV